MTRTIGRALNSLKAIGIIPKNTPTKESLMADIIKYSKIYFGKYRLESEIEELQETKRVLMSKDLTYRNIFKKDFDMSKRFIKSMITHIKNRSNAIIMTYGLPNSGKSEVGQSIAINIIRRFAKLLNIDSKVNIIFEPSGLGKISGDLHQVDQVILDEMPDAEGVGSVNYKKDMNNITKIVRQQQIFFYFTSPEMIKLKVVNYYLETYGKCKEKRITRCRLYDKKCELVGMVYIKVHDDEEFRKKYLELKTENIRKLLRKGGKVVGSVNIDQLITDVKKVLEISKNLGIDKKEEVEFLVTDPDTPLDITGDLNYIKMVVRSAWFRIKREEYTYRPIDGNIDLLPDGEDEDEENDEDDTKEDIIDGEFTEEENIEFVNKKDDAIQVIDDIPSINPLEISDDFPDFVLKEESKKTTFQIAKCRSLIAKGYTYDDLREALNINSDQWVFDTTDKWKNPQEGGKKCEAWKLLERWWAIKVGANPKNTGGNTRGKPDCEINKMVFSIKWRYDNAKRIKFYQSKDCNPERKRAIELGCNYYLVFYNPKWRSNRLLVIPISPKSDEEIILDKSGKRVN